MTDETDMGYKVFTPQAPHPIERLMARAAPPAPATDPTTALLAERGKTHGDFTAHATATQGMKRLFRGVAQRCTVPARGDPLGVGPKLNDVQQEAVDMILHKLGRIAAGDPNFKDHWDDIAGYARLVSERCE